MRTPLLTKSKVIVLILVPLLFLTLPENTPGQEITIGVVEFEEKNSIGLENAGRIVAEWVVTEIKNRQLPGSGTSPPQQGPGGTEPHALRRDR